MILFSIDGLVAIQVTSPNANSVWNLKSANTVTWTTVSTDPSTINIVLANQNANCAPTGTTQVIKENVSTSDGKYEISGIPDVKDCAGYQINLVSTSNNGILAQSAPFNSSSAGQGSQGRVIASIQPTISHFGDITQPALNATATQLAGGGGNAYSNVTLSDSLTAQKIASQGASPNGTATASSGPTVLLSPPAVLAFLLLPTSLFLF